MVLVAVYNSEGLVGRCDAKCYEAKHAGCVCVCGGANHGAGLNKAMDNTREMAQEWIEEYARQNDLAEYEGLVNEKPFQLSLPLGG
ncbi:MAG: hypothetical protein L0331_05865 [Chloroflexi bacterium]|nr:hypothetical protein [Chloroflexota bacterium]